MDVVLPYNIEIETEELLNGYVKDNYPEVIEKISSFGFNPKAKIQFTSDLDLLSQLDMKNIPKAGLFN